MCLILSSVSGPLNSSQDAGARGCQRGGGNGREVRTGTTAIQGQSSD